MNIDPILSPLQCDNQQYAFYLQRHGAPAVLHGNCERFPSASIIKVPILLAWAHLERQGQLDRSELCCLDDEPQVQGAGFSWLLHNRRIPYQDVLMLMISLSDNLCTNLVIRRVGLERLNAAFRQLGLNGVELQRKLMDYDARARGLDNWITVQDCIRLYDCIAALSPEERAWIEPMLLVNQDSSLLLRDIRRDTLDFYHKTGSIPNVLHDWGYTRNCRLFLLTARWNDEAAVNRVFGQLGQLLLPPE